MPRWCGCFLGKECFLARLVEKKVTDSMSTEDFYSVVVNSVPLMDVRAPVEFAAGAFPFAVNLPLMDDSERHRVGKCYKQQGRDTAIQLASSLVSGELRAGRIRAWGEFHRRHPQALFYCFRGGMRSRTAQEWLRQESDREVVRLEGGYKAFRRFLLEALDPGKIRAVPVLLGGRTGAGKTVLLQHLRHAIDLEEIANHRGSAFGGHLSPQPTQIDFENRLAYAIIGHGHAGFAHMILEDEGSYIGARYIPLELAAYFKRDSMVLLESDMAERIARTHDEYVVEAQRHYRALHGDQQGVPLWLENIGSRLTRIRKRLGSERLQRVLALLDNAHALQLAEGDSSAHRLWIEVLLREYYDPMYDYQIVKSGRTISFKGEFHEVLAYLQHLEG